MRPRLAVVDRFVHAITDREIGADDAGAAAHVDDVWIGRGDRDGPDRAGGLVIEQRYPVRAVVSAAPHAAVVETGVEHIGLGGHTGEGARASGAHGADRPPVQRPERGGHGGGGRLRGQAARGRPQHGGEREHERAAGVQGTRRAHGSAWQRKGETEDAGQHAAHGGARPVGQRGAAAHRWRIATSASEPLNDGPKPGIFTTLCIPTFVPAASR